MTLKNRLNIMISLLMIFIIVLACNTDETSKANEHVDKANTSIDSANAALKDANSKNAAMINAEKNVKSNSEIEPVKTMAKEAIAAFDKASADYSEASKQFGEAGKLKVQDKFKEYLQTKADEMKKRSEMCNAAKGIAQALIDSKNRTEYEQKISGVDDKVANIGKEAKELADKAEKIREENKDIFKN